MCVAQLEEFFFTYFLFCHVELGLQESEQAVELLKRYVYSVVKGIEKIGKVRRFSLKNAIDFNGFTGMILSCVIFPDL